ncbi:putative SP-containing membrane protein [Vairimorpha necatrix]|uniref:SP-containing membrane protein n=1 Tax=Vairimorpha necatrix TaxID=6039 RepID=A0AAX4JCN5_9MICR
MSLLFLYLIYLAFIVSTILLDASQTNWIDDITNISSDQYCDLFDNQVHGFGISESNVRYLAEFVWHTLTSNKFFIYILKKNNIAMFFKNNYEKLYNMYVENLLTRSHISYVPNFSQKLPFSEDRFISNLIITTRNIISSLNMCHKDSIYISESRINTIQNIINDNLCFLNDDVNQLPSFYFRNCKGFLKHFVECYKDQLKNSKINWKENHPFLNTNKCVYYKFGHEFMKNTTANSNSNENAEYNNVNGIMNTVSTSFFDNAMNGNILNNLNSIFEKKKNNTNFMNTATSNISDIINTTSTIYLNTESDNPDIMNTTTTSFIDTASGNPDIMNNVNTTLDTFINSTNFLNSNHFNNSDLMNEIFSYNVDRNTTSWNFHYIVGVFTIITLLIVGGIRLYRYCNRKTNNNEYNLAEREEPETSV